MSLGAPAIPGVRALQLRDVQVAIDRIRERFQAVESQLTTTTAQAGQSTLTLGQSNASISNLQRQLSALVSRVDAIGAPTDKLETFLAAAAIEQYDPVYVTTAGSVSPARPSEPDAIYGVIGVATTAAALGASVVVRKSGTMQITGAAFQAGGPVYAGLDGLTQFPDYVGVAVPVGVAVGADRLDVTPGWPALQYPGVYSEFETFLPATWGLVRDAVQLTDDFNAAASGIVTKIGFGDVTTRAVTGTANRVTVTDGDGVAGDPTVDISSNYVGQASITTLGTVTTGVWGASTIAADRGGTGVANAAGSTITLGGALSFSGVFTTAFTITGDTSVVLPTSGTLATTDQLSVGADPTAQVGFTAVAGTAETFIRSDGAPALATTLVTPGADSFSLSTDSDAEATTDRGDITLTAGSNLTYAGSSLLLGGANSASGGSTAITAGGAISLTSDTFAITTAGVTLLTFGSDVEAEIAGELLFFGQSNVVFDAQQDLSLGALNSVSLSATDADVSIVSVSGELILGAGTGIRLQCTAGNVRMLDSSIKIETIGKGIDIAEGANARMGLATLSGGTVTVNTTAVESDSRVFLTPQDAGTITSPAALEVSARTAGTSFTISSADAADDRTVAWVIIGPV